MSNFVPLKGLLKKSLKRTGIFRRVEAVQIIDCFENVVALELLSREMRNQVKPISVRNKTIKIAVLSPLVGRELKFKEKEIIRMINKHFHKRVVERIYVEC